MKKIKQIKIFIACPNDIAMEKDSIELVVGELNKTTGKQNGFIIDLLNWKTDIYTQIGEDAQDVINKQIDTKYDILIGILWLKIGTPTKRDKSGTVEEINRAISNNKELLIYFNTSPPDSMKSLDLDQYSHVKKFKNELSEQGVLYKEYELIKNFESLFRIDLSNLVIDKIIQGKDNIKSTQIKPKSSKYSSITELITEIENKNHKLDEIDIFEIAEETVSILNSVTISMNSITESLKYLTEKLEQRTAEINKFLKIKDERFKMNKMRTIVNLLANELNEFNLRIQNELPTFSKNFISVGGTYSKLMLAASSYKISEFEDLKSNTSGFKSSVEEAMVGCAELIKAIMKWPPLNHNFNKSKRDTELVLKDLMKHMLEGLNLLDAALN